MKVCICFNHFQDSDGVARAAVSIANLLSMNGFDVTIIPIFAYKQTEISELSTDVRVKPVLRFYFRGLARILDLLPGRWIYRLIVRDRYDIEVGFQHGISIKAISHSRNRSARHLGWVHGYDEKLEQKQSYQKLDVMICVSKANAIRLKHELQSDLQIDYCYNPINDKIVREKGKEKVELLTDGHPLFVSVGRHSPEKGYSRLLDCVARLHHDGYKFQLWLVGDGPEHEKLKMKSQELSLDHIVTFVGGTSNPHAYTSKADVFICSSFREGYSTACTEAIMLNVPVISTEVSGADEIIEDAECGMVVGLDDESLYQGMKTILDKPDLLQTWKEKLEITKNRFSYESRSEKILDVFSIDETNNE